MNTTNIGDFAIIRLFPPSPADLKPKMSGINHNDNNHETRQKLLGEVVSMVDNKDVKMWKKAGEWYVQPTPLVLEYDQLWTVHNTVFAIPVLT